MPAVALRAIRRTFGAVTALDGVDLTIEEGEFVAIVGPSGCGKSTLLRAVAGLEEVDAGEVEVQRAGIAYVFQDAHLLPWRTVARNIALPLELRGERDVGAAVSAVLAEVELADSADRYPGELSGGMRMRASIARALVTRPRLLLMDEPFAALDELTRQRLDERLRALWQSHGLTVVFVTHSIFEATFLADRVIVMSRRPGRLVHDARIDLPRDRTSATRTDPRFTRAVSEVMSALERGSE
jgi:NitT/TauT family transport system ATP-binding protein